jgi:hypothetical protein
MSANPLADRASLPLKSITKKPTEIKNMSYGNSIEIDEEEKSERLKALERHHDTTVGLWATDRPELFKDHPHHRLLFEIRTPANVKVHLRAERKRKNQIMKSDTTSTTESVVGGAQPRLVMHSYSRECDGDRERMLEMALRDLWRNYPEWPSTFGPCLHPECDRSGRGSGFCAKCVTEGIADIVGMNGPAEAMLRAVDDARRTADKLREMVSSS